MSKCKKFKYHWKNCACEFQGYITDNIHNHYVDCVKCKTWMVGGDDYL